MSRNLLAGIVLAGVLSAYVPVAAAQAADAATTQKFRIVRFDVTGNTLLSAAEVEHIVASYTGDDKDFGDIQRALEALEQAYRNRGYGSVQVLLPEQDITAGVVKLRVTEPRIGKVKVEDNKYFDVANVRASLPTLKEGTPPNAQAIARNLQLLDEHPTKQTTVLLRSGDTDDELDAVVKIKDVKPLRYFATLDNTGTKETGNERLGVGFQHSNLFDRDQTLTVQYQTSPTEASDVKIAFAGYHIPFYAHNSSLDLLAAYSNVDSGTIQDVFNVSGSGSVYGAHYNIYLSKLLGGAYEHKVTVGIDYRAYKPELEQSGVRLSGVGGVDDITVHPVSVTYNGLWRMKQAQLQFYLSWAQNLFPGGNDGTDADFKLDRFDARAGYRVWRLGATYLRLLPKDWQVRAVFADQVTSDALVPGEQFGFGGPDSVRGFNQREVSNDRGYTTSIELYTPDFSSQVKLPWQDVRLRALAFYDMGTVSRNSPQPGDPPDQSGASVGIGWRLAIGQHFNLRADWAHVIDPAGQQGRDDDMIHAAIALIF
ncbi:MAG TPA: ShlB/FhaC/HecB family hemolysin secretion/activation protein [Burkholderiales bacterium]|nr:ShlB/FhaC/HecB family hemolysin secretion/activation protein [Burkholderiales bacterium]